MAEDDKDVPTTEHPGDVAVPPYEGRSGGDQRTGLQDELAEGVHRAMTGEAPEEPRQPQGPAVGQKEGKMAPEGVGESLGRRGEDQAKGDGEPGRQDAGREGADRAGGTSTARDKTSVDPQD